MTDQTQIQDNHKINPSLDAHKVPIDVPIVHPRNARIGDVDAIKESLDRFGQVRPILVQKQTAFIVAGNHTYKAAAELAWTHIAAVAVDLSDHDALAYMVADNRLADRGDYDDAALNEALNQLMLAGQLAGTGFSPDDVEDRLSAMDAFAEVQPEGFEGAHAESDEEIQERYSERSTSGPLRQFMVLYPQEVGEEVAALIQRLRRAWGVGKTRDVILEALRRANADPPVEHLTPEEKERADAPEPVPDPETGEVPQPPGVNDDGSPMHNHPDGIAYYTNCPACNPGGA